jgi:UDP-N-acetylglucosamine--N-acetylmuramyl-(pentapeptide) pyrophosphoryl-undecaprenol N-acetylglucosamine transferase
VRRVHVVLAGGGTAGHIEPALSLADALRRADEQIGITALGTARGLETKLVPERGYELALIPAVPLPRKPTPELLGVPGRLSGAVRKVGAILDEVGADVIAGFGGYVAMPAYLAARSHGTPLVIHEANARPGLANRIGAKITTFVATGAPETRLPHARHIGIPLRRSIATLDRQAMRPFGRTEFGLQPDRPTLLVFGGSQGARRLNETVSAAAPRLLAAGVQILHVVGPNNPSEVTAPPSGPPYVTVPYIDRMDLAYAAADFVLCRGGAMTCAELAAVGLPAAYVPLPIGNGEQRLNAAPVVRAGGGLLVDDVALTADWVFSELVPVLVDPVRLQGMGKAASDFGHRDADEVLARMVYDAVGRPYPGTAAAAGSGTGPGAPS